MSKKELTELIKTRIADTGFDLCGVARARKADDHGMKIRGWCSSGMNGRMDYLCRNIDRRIDPGSLFHGAKSVVVAGLNYYTDRKQEGNGIPIISRYAYGNDYHDVLEKRLGSVLEYIKNLIPGADGRVCVDSAPVIEKAWAREAGLGWYGRHSVLISNKIGSFFFIGIIILNQDLIYDDPFSEDMCGTCRLCIDACPTGAINEDRTIDARKCISYLTVEGKDPVSKDIAGKVRGRVFGCDICQDVCPWNNNAKPHNTDDFSLPEEIERMSAVEWRSLSKNKFDQLFEKSAISRRKYEQFMGNIIRITG